MGSSRKGTLNKVPEDYGHHLLKLDDLIPNTWNPNVLQGVIFEKLETNIIETLKETGGSLPPIVVRPHPDQDGKYEIIDGFHRYKVYKKLGKDEIDSFVVDADDKFARLLTGNLNYLRGEKNPERYTALLVQLMDEGMSSTELASLVPEDETDVQDLVSTYGDAAAVRSFLDAQKRSAEDYTQPTGALDDDNVFVDLKFRVSMSQAKIVNKELERIAKAIKGKNAEGRALEFMAVQSSQTDLPAEIAPTPVKAPRPSAKKSAKERAKEKLSKMGANE